MSKKQKNYNPNKHRFLFSVLRGIGFLYSRLIIGYRCKDKYRAKRGESVVVLSNHQTDADPFCVLTSFKFPVHPVAADNIFAGKFRSKLFNSLGVIAKKKGVSDVRTAVKMKQVIDGGGSLLIFPEGNRTFCEFQFYIAESTVALLKKFKSTVVLFNLHGGTGRAPRFKNKNRKGRFYGEIKRVLKYEDYADMPDAELLELIKSELKVFDGESGEVYKSERRAEYLERIFFVCPNCKKTQTLYSEGNYLYCLNCGAKTEYTENLRLKSEDGKIPFERLIDYWNYQKRYLKEREISEGEEIFTDENVKVFLSNPYEKRKLIYKGGISLTDKYLYYGKEKFNLKTVEISSVVSGRNLVFLSEGNNYTLRGGKRFNPLKYALIFNKLDTLMKEKKTDLYFNLEED